MQKVVLQIVNIGGGEIFCVFWRMVEEESLVTFSTFIFSCYVAGLLYGMAVLSYKVLLYRAVWWDLWPAETLLLTGSIVAVSNM